MSGTGLNHMYMLAHAVLTKGETKVQGVVVLQLLPVLLIEVATGMAVQIPLQADQAAQLLLGFLGFRALSQAGQFCHPTSLAARQLSTSKKRQRRNMVIGCGHAPSL